MSPSAISTRAVIRGASVTVTFPKREGNTGAQELPGEGHRLDSDLHEVAYN